MIERPILFSTPMVQAILAGRKTQTRRTNKLEEVNERAGDFIRPILDSNGEWVFSSELGAPKQVRVKCPYGKPGDLLWVRESCTWIINDHAHDLLEGSRENTQWVYKASMHEDFMEYAKEKYGYKWKPSIHMPKAAARIWLKVTNVRVERLHNITDNDVSAEGAQDSWFSTYELASEPKQGWMLNGFKRLWQSINGEQSWNANPWVWVVEFERIEK